MSSAEAGTPPLQALLNAFNAHDVDTITRVIRRVTLPLACIASAADVACGHDSPRLPG